MTNPKRGEMQITLGSQSWDARITMDVLAKIEQACGCGVLKVLQKLTEAEVTSTEICHILLPAIRAGGNDVTLKDIQDAVWTAGLTVGMKEVGAVLTKALMPEEESAGNVQKAVLA